jgi:endogenous inhibitor of DNA gyrase (YacG/DUF329 family)
VDLGRWVNEKYGIPVEESDADVASSGDGETPPPRIKKEDIA